MTEALAEFGLWCLREMRYPAPGDIDGGEAQNEAKRLGLLFEVLVDHACAEDCACAEYHGEFPVMCLRESAAVAAAAGHLDARLISAAPELLEACEAALCAIDVTPFTSPELISAASALRAAIAKTRGTK